MSKRIVLFVACLRIVYSQDWGFAQDQASDPKEIADLKRQIQELKLENAVLKKTGDAIFLERLGTSLKEARSALSESQERVLTLGKVLKKFQDERKLLLELIADKKGDKRDGLILGLQQKIEQLINERDEAKNQLETVVNRAATAIQDANSLRKQLFELRREKIPANKDQKENAPQVNENFPTKSVKGKITKVNEKTNIIAIDVGSDHGLKKGHTLEVYRLQPALEYVGVLHLVDVEKTRAVGQMVMFGRSPKTTKVGDIVSNSLELGR